MKKAAFVFGLVSCLAFSSKAQEVSLSEVKIMNNDSTLLISNNDTSYVFNAYVLTQGLGGISSVTLVCQDYANSSWTTVTDTVYTWTQVISDSLTNQQLSAWKLNDNIMVMCLGRLYYATRHKFIFTINGSNGILTREYIF